MEQRNYKLYVHISPSNKRYYGITSEQNINIRWKNGNGYNYNSHFTNAINKYGWDNFEHQVLFNNLTKEEACLLEKLYIGLYNTTNPKYGYNSTYGGDTGVMHTEETRRKLSEQKKGDNNPAKRTEVRKKISEAHIGKTVTEETRKKLSENSKKMWADPNSKVHDPSVRAKINEANTGRYVSQETRKKLSESHKGIAVSIEARKKISNKLKGTKMGDDNPMKRPEVRKKVSEALKGKKLSQETRKKISEALKGENNYNYGKQLSEEQKRKISESRKGKLKGKHNPNAKPVLMFTLNGEFIRKFDSTADANEFLGKKRDSNSIGRCANGITKTSWGYIWKWYTEEQEEELAL